MIEDCSIFLIKTALDLYIFEAEFGQRVDLPEFDQVQSLIQLWCHEGPRDAFLCPTYSAVDEDVSKGALLACWLAISKGRATKHLALRTLQSSFQLHVPELQRTIRTEAIFPDSLRLTALLPIVIAIVARSSALAAIKLKRTLEKKGLRLRKAPATFLLTAQLRAGTQLVALARHSAPRLTSAAKTFSLGACLSNTKRGFRSL
ncbi:hypothetical protein L2E82_33346 [Cichorium intybus]|uniref:Uncharacterized protein n=1 Tax=Cichorium intybus TaxID=13427 RepID=A0ACB9BJX2_CICIN|nr:hypothetical protein L2E82_33346 [Cichorium intybus]